MESDDQEPSLQEIVDFYDSITGQRLPYTLWQGVMLYYVAKAKPPLPLACTFTSSSSELCTDAATWLGVPVLRLCRGTTVSRLILEGCSRNAHRVKIHLSEEAEALLNTAVEPGVMGCVFVSCHLRRIILLFGKHDRHIYEGFIAYDQTHPQCMDRRLLHMTDLEKLDKLYPLLLQGAAGSSSNSKQAAPTNQLKATRHLPVPRTSPYPKSKPNEPVPSCTAAETSGASGSGTNTASADPFHDWFLEEDMSFESQASKLFPKDLVQKVMEKIIRETGEPPKTVVKLYDAILRYIGARPEPPADEEAIEELLCKMNECVLNLNK